MHWIIIATPHHILTSRCTICSIGSQSCSNFISINFFLLFFFLVPCHFLLSCSTTNNATPIRKTIFLDSPRKRKKKYIYIINNADSFKNDYTQNKEIRNSYKLPLVFCSIYLPEDGEILHRESNFINKMSNKLENI